MATVIGNRTCKITVNKSTFRYLEVWTKTENGDETWSLSYEGREPVDPPHYVSTAFLEKRIDYDINRGCTVHFKQYPLIKEESK